ncbi:MAG TPA: chemotaxis protein CheA [Clostridia bacterium]|nr:chemotaxis protein CheA [Clostridia bacterium]
MDSDKYIGLFVEEAKEHIQILNDNLLRLEAEANNENVEPLNEVFRAAHTLKGMAGTLGFGKITDIAHAMENILDEIRNQNMGINASIIDILLECTDAMEELILDVSRSGDEGPQEISELLLKLNKPMHSFDNSTGNGSDYGAVELDEYQSSVINTGISQGLIPYWIEVVLQPTCLLKAARAYVVFQALEEFGEIIKTLPQVQDIEEERFEDTFGMLLLSREEDSIIKQRLDLVSELHSVKIHRISHNLDLDANDKSVGPDDKAKEPVSGNQRILRDKIYTQTRSIRVDTEKLDNLMNLVSELITIKNSLMDVTGSDVESSTREYMEYLARITNGLHDTVTKVRMVPIEMVFSRFPRVIRDLSRNIKKEIALNIIGSETEIDRTIIDEIGDPLIHLLRNAVDHGIETPEERVEAGKDPVGRVDLMAYHDGNNVVIHVEDDGHGIDLENIANSAMEKGLISDIDLGSLEEREIIGLMFHPGFSTAGTISNISGRGVGMDVVKTKVESMGGTIDVTTQIGVGSRFTIRLPLTLSIIQALLVEVGNEIYAIPLNSIQEIVDISGSDIKRFEGHETIPYNDILLPLIRLESELDTELMNSRQDQIMTMIIVKKGDRRFALSIGNLIGQQEIVIKPLGKYLSNNKIISGATILGNGKVALILDINHLV